MSQVSKKRKTLTRTVTLPKVSNEVAQLRRTVLASKPELRQASYSLTIVANETTPTALINPTLIDAGTEEIKLHRIAVNFQYNDVDIPWAVIYSPRQGYNITDIPFGLDGYSTTNFLRHMDSTKQRIFFRKHWGREIVVGNDNKSLLECDRKFSIPMKVGMRDPGNQTVNHNQLYFIGGIRNAQSSRILEVTVWYTC